MVNPDSMLRLCLLLDSGRDQSNLKPVKTSLLCLRGHPDVPVSLFDIEGGRYAEQVKNFVVKNFTNNTEIVTAPILRSIDEGFNDHSELTFFLFLPVGDWLSDDALAKICSAVRDVQPDIVYTDEDRFNEAGHLVDPQFKPDAAPEFFLHSDYVGSMLCIKGSTLARYGGIDLKHYHKERYRLLLRAFFDKARVEHVAQPLYHVQYGSLRESGGFDDVLTKHCKEHGVKVEAERIGSNAYRLRHKIRGNPKVSIVIPFKDKPELLKQCLNAIIANTEYANFEVVGISNRSVSLTVYELMQEFSAQDRRFRFLECNIPFNFSALVNFGVAAATGEYIVLMNNDVTVINPGWLHAMLQQGQKKEVGVVGAKLLYPDNTIQHAGITIQQSGYIGHLHKHCDADNKGYMNRLICVQNVSAVTGALCLFQKILHQQLNGFDESRFGIAFNDVDFCLRAEANQCIHTARTGIPSRIPHPWV